MREIVRALPPFYDAVLHNWNDRFKAYALCQPTPEAERRERMLRHDYTGIELASGPFSLLLVTNVFGSAAARPEHFEWEEKDGMKCGRWKATALEELKPKIEAARTAWLAARAEIAKQPRAPDISEAQAEWDRAFEVVQVKYWMLLADLAGIRKPERLPLERLAVLEFGVKTKAIPKEDFISEIIGERPEGEKTFEVPDELKNDFWAYIQGPKNQFVKTRNVVKKAG